MDPARLVKLKPVGNRIANSRIATSAEAVSRCAPALGLSALQTERHLEAALYLSILLGPELSICPAEGFVNLEEVVHDGKQVAAREAWKTGRGAGSVPGL